MMPPDEMIERAARHARNSPCAKSKRGVVTFAGTQVLSLGFNGPPMIMPCDGRRCRQSCRQVAVHAEERAVFGLQRALLRGSIGDPVELLHVKVDQERAQRFVHPSAAVVASGPPSCITCSRTIFDSSLVSFVWLLEARLWHDDLECEQCRQKTTVEQFGASDMVCRKCDGGILRFGKRIYEPDSGVWKRYSAHQFHLATLDELGLYGAPQ